jgi:amino acid adenylation domain
MESNVYNLTNPQKSIWFTEQFYKGTPIENITGCVIVLEKLNLKALQKAINLFVKSNDSFRLKFTVKDDKPLQYLSSFSEFEIENVMVNTDEDIKDIENKMSNTPFEVLDNLLFSFKTFTFPDGHGGFVITAHHLISDAWTAGLVVNEIMDYYEKIINSQIIDNQNPSYLDYITSEQEYLNSEKFNKDKEFWNEIFKTVPEVATIPSINVENSNSSLSCKAKRKQFVIPKETMNLINEFCKQNKASAFNFFMAVLAIYLSRVSSLDDFTIGTPILNRGNFKEKQTTGMYISTIPFRISINHKIPFAEFLSNISADFLKIFRHQKYPYQYLLEDLRKKDSSIPNLYNILLSYQNVRSNKQTSDINYESSWVGNNFISDDIDIHLYDMNDTGDINIAYDYLISKYSIDDICSIHARFLYIINQVLENNDITLNEIEIVTPDEKKKILYDFNNTSADYPRDKTITQLFEEQVEKTPDNIAVVFENQKLTYRELNERANSLANYLRNNGVGLNDSVAIFLDKSLEMIVAILAILKVDALYVPIDIDYPDNRINFMLSDSNAKIVLTKRAFLLDLDFENTLAIDLCNTIYLDNKTFPSKHAGDLAYVMYTSGSTGNPKGVVVKQKSIIRLVKNPNYINFHKNEKILQTGSIVFDACTFEIWASLLNGFELYIIKKSELLDPNSLKSYLIENKITILWLTAPLLNQLCENHPDMFKTVRCLLTGGDVLSPKHINLIRKVCPDLTIINGYGPTENTTFSTCFTINDYYNDSIPIGYPISNSTCYIVSQDMNLLPIGIPGELVVGGDGVAKGYINNQAFTDLKFLSSPFNNDFLYKTGDLAKWNFDGSISFIGRIDGQVKIRGFRVELGEINLKILEFPNIKTSFTTIKTINGEKFICSYIVCNQMLNVEDLKHFLMKFLPNYAIPTYFIKLDKLPINTNGKVDSKLLPSPQLVNTKSQIIPARNIVDQKIIFVLKEILNINKISIDDSFFDLGGDSLTAITLCSKIYNEFNIQLSIKDILENPIIKDLSDVISSKDLHNKNCPLKKAEIKDIYQASFAQKRIFYSTQAISGGNNVVYNISGGLLIDSVLDVNKIVDCINKIVNNQSSFRTQFEIVDGQLYQRIINHAQIKIDCYNGQEKDLQSILDKFPKPFDLTTAPLLRASVYVLDNKKTLLLLDTHHIIMDGASLNILIQDFCTLYSNNNIDKLKFEYIDYSEWEKSFVESDEIKKYDEYWASTFANSQISSLNLPYDFPANSKSYEGDKISYNMPKETFSKIEELAKKHDVSAYTVFLSALYILLYKYTGQTNLIVGSPLEGRNYEEFNNIIGMFVNNIVLKNDILPENSVDSLLNSTQNIVTNAISNQPYPYELILKKLNLDKNTSLLDVVLTYQNTKKSKYNIENANLELLYSNTKTAKFNIWLEIIPDLARFNLEYNSSLFKKETINSFLEHYIFILNQLISNTTISIDDIEIITPKEKALLKQFNNTDGPINDDTVVSIFEEQVKMHPDNIAIICNDKTLTYDELNKRANSLAHLLIEKGIGANDIVCVMTNRSFETIVCMMAILKAGAAFFNVDPNYPIERTKYYLEDSKTKYVLTQTELKDRVSSIENCIEIDLSIEDIYNKNFENPNVKINRGDLSYLIYTSGSTGKPKGAMLNQVGFANMVKAMTLVLDYLKEGNKHCIASVTSTPFDIFVYEIIVSLTHGLKIAMANNAEHRNPKLLDELIRKCHVDVMTVTPSLMKINYDNREPDTALAQVKNMVFGGEPLPEKFVEDLRALADDITIYNIYGPSEITILCNVQNLNGEKEITIGPPIMNTQIHILDKNMKPLPIGVVGEIYISGIQVGYGYIGKPELTAEKFLDNPFGEGKMYKSGDIGRWTFDGKVQCLGRIDNQIKLRGLRIELGEIENVMLNVPNVSSAVVNKIEIDGKEALCGYYACDKDVSEDIVKDALRKALPAYMVPTYIVKLDQMPYTINRKIDRKALPLPELNKPVANNKINIEELNSVEEKLLQIWKNILKIDDIDINDNFFDIGGDSVAAISMQIEAVKYGLEFEYGDIFAFPTIKQLSANLKTPDEIFIKNYDYSKVNSVLARNTMDNLNTIKKIKFNNMLLIGSTGYLGAHVLDAFLQSNKGIAYCLVREKDGLDIKERLRGVLNFYFGNKYNELFNNRIKVVCGDIVKENLGLSEKDYSELKNNIDIVINSGALVKHFGIKKKFEEINVKGTQSVIDFCLNTKKRLLHVSTISVSGNGEKEETVIETPENINDKKIFKESDIYVGQNIKGVYSTTKFRAELLVLEAISSKGLDAQILRLGNITNRYSDGVFQMNADENAFAKRIKSFIEIGAFPKYMLKHSIELTPVDLAAEAIVKVANYTSHCNVLHIYDNNLLPIKLFIETLSELGINLLPVPEKMMTDIITGILADNNRKDILSGIIYDLNENKQLVYTSRIRLNSNFTEGFLERIRFNWKSIDKDYIIRYINYLRKIKFIK